MPRDFSFATLSHALEAIHATGGGNSMSSGRVPDEQIDAGLEAEVFVDDEDQTLFDDGYALVGAVHHLVSASRAATKLDMVLAAACHALKGGSKTLDEIVLVVDRVWPGAKVDARSVLDSLHMGAELNQVQRGDGLGGVELWELAAEGVRDIHAQEAWVSRIRSAAVDDLRTMAHNGLGVDISLAKAELWLDFVVRALIAGITAAQDAYLGRVNRLVGKRLAPQGIDQGLVMRQIESTPSDPATVQFLKTIALSALDPLQPFANELVHCITTGCVLHSYVAGRDSAAVIEQLGIPRAQRAILDTPVLLDLIGPTRISSAVERSIRTAIQAGWEVVVGRHTLDELQLLVEHEVPDLVRSFQRAHAQGVREEWVASLASDQLPAYWIESHREGKYRKASDMVAAAVGIQETLENLGVVVRYHYNENDAGKVAQFATALRSDLVGSRPRTETVVERDADSMTMAWRRRRREPKGSKWPGGWIITPDRHMKRAYARVEKSDRTSITLTLSQWSTLCSIVVQPADVVALADAAATQLVDEALWLLPSRFPSDVAFELARQLSPDRGGSETDLRIAQLTLDGELERVAGRTPVAMAADVLAARTTRVNSLAEQAIADAKLGEDSARGDARAAAIRAAESDKQLTGEREHHRQTREREAELAATVAWRAKQLKRVLWSFLVGLISAVGLIVVFGLTSELLPRLLAVGGFVAIGYALIVWCRRESARLVWTLFGAVAQVLGLGASAVGLLVDLQAVN